MAENDRDIWEVIASVLNGNPSAEEQHLFDLWMSSTEENRKFYETLLRTKLKQETFTTEAQRRVYAKIGMSMQAAKAPRKINLWAYSAVASIAVLLTLLIYNVFLSTHDKVNISYIEAKTPFGVKSKISLPDGSFVYLNSGSTLKYPAVFEKKQRKVLLNGEAFFEVEKDAKHPFIVETGDLNIKVLGTHFNVKNFEDDEVIETSLLEGSVEVFKTAEAGVEHKIKLNPNQQAVYDKRSRKIIKRKVDAVLASIWKEGKYYFENDRFSSIAAKLERNFNVKIKISSEALNDKVYSGLFDKNRTIFQILDVMKNYSNFSYTVKKDTIIIKDITKK